MHLDLIPPRVMLLSVSPQNHTSCQMPTSIRPVVPEQSFRPNPGTLNQLSIPDAIILFIFFILWVSYIDFKSHLKNRKGHIPKLTHDNLLLSLKESFPALTQCLLVRVSLNTDVDLATGFLLEEVTQ